MPKLIYHDSDGMDKMLPLGSEPVLIGRATECQVQTQDAMVSRRHARIFWDGNYWIEDLGSSNGVYVGNDKVQKAPFRPGDTVTCGSLVLRLMPDTAPRTTGSMAPMHTGAMAPVRTGLTPPGGEPSPRFQPLNAGQMAPPPPAPPPPSGNYASPPASGSYAPPPASGNYASPPASGGYASPPASGNYASPPASGGYASPPASGNYASPPAGGGYVAPPSGAFSVPPGYGGAPPTGQPLAATLPPPAAPPRPTGADMQIGPNAFLRGGTASPSATTGPQAGASEELRAERQRRETAEAGVLQAAERVKRAEARVAELEPLARDAQLLQRKLEQTQADLRRLRGGQPIEEHRDDGETERLRGRVAQLEADLAAAQRAATANAAAGSAAGGGAATAAIAAAEAEATRARRQVEQLQAELRRVRGGAPAAPEPPAAVPRNDAALADAAIALGDSLAELRSSLRAANDEAGLLTAPSESVQVVGDALRSASEQLEQARTNLRALGKLLGVS